MASRQLLSRVSTLEQSIRQASGVRYSTVFGIVAADGRLVRSRKKLAGAWVESSDTPDVYIAEKLEPALLSRSGFMT